MQMRRMLGFLAAAERGSVAIRINRVKRRIGFIEWFLKRRKRKRKIALFGVIEYRDWEFVVLTRREGPYLARHELSFFDFAQRSYPSEAMTFKHLVIGLGV